MGPEFDPPREHLVLKGCMVFTPYNLFYLNTICTEDFKASKYAEELHQIIWRERYCYIDKLKYRSGFTHP